ncbi:hypothetical protein [Roseivirga thermotolerans]|uniref:hypothetical protein n=1 Tax=Roseivirga thermotolerans TaxID=1758176 RepID=UPI00273D8711|nr:hypothetical protein [Roseivirga thermotolerans]
MKNYAFILLVISILGCSQSIDIDPDTGFEVFTIPEGSHSSIFRNEPFSGNGISVTALFDESARYTLEVASDQADINKLVGFSDCGQDHQSESARIGWRWFNDELQILAYTYREGQLNFEMMGTAKINESLSLRIKIATDHYEYSGDGMNTIRMPRTDNCESGENYWLWPYFGGNQPAPHDITIRLTREVID